MAKQFSMLDSVPTSKGAGVLHSRCDIADKFVAPLAVYLTKLSIPEIT